MAGRITAHVFIDANTALHFKRPDQIDWPHLTGASEIILVAAPIFLRELENQKIVNASRKLRDRASEYIKWLYPFVLNSAIEVRSAVRWLFLSNEPQVDFGAKQLSLNLPDDHLIASVLDYAPDPEGLILVATADIGLDVKLRARGIEVLVLPEDARLPAEPDPLERENRTLRREIARLRSRMPKLSVAFKGGAQHDTIYLSNPHSADVPSLAQVEAEHPPMVGRHLYELSRDRVDGYNRELGKYYREYERYLADLEAWRKKIRLYAMIELVIANDGTAPASNIDLELDFPDGVTSVDTDDFPKEPKPPKPPRRPRGFIDIPMLTDTDYVSSLSRAAPDLSAMINPNYDGVPVIGQDTSSVRIGLSSLKHGFTIECDPFLIRLRSQQSIRGFSIAYRLSADELLNAVTGKIHIQIDDREG